MKAPICPQTGNTPDCPASFDGATGHDPGDTERPAWQTPRLYHLDVGADTEFHVVGFKVDGNSFLS